jgi:hypothetical protein
MKNLSQSECIKICELIKPELKWEWNDHFDMDEPPYFAINGTGNSDKLYMIRLYYTNDSITLIDSNSEDIHEEVVDFKANSEILKIISNSSNIQYMENNIDEKNQTFVQKVANYLFEENKKLGIVVSILVSFLPIAVHALLFNYYWDRSMGPNLLESIPFGIFLISLFSSFFNFVGLIYKIKIGYWVNGILLVFYAGFGSWLYIILCLLYFSVLFDKDFR